MAEATATAQRTLVITRVFDAPPRLVFNAWSKPEQLVRWFGPNNFTVPACEQEFREGGTYRFCMHAPDGGDHWVWGEYREISEYDRLVFTWVRQDDKSKPWVDNVVTLTFEEQDGKTVFTLHHALFDTPEFRDEHEGGWSECMDRLGAFVSTIDREIITIRIINTPRERVFKAWTDPDILSRWWGPKGFTNTFHTFELRPDGIWDFTMHGPDGTNYHNTSVFERIEAPTLLVFNHLKPMHRFHVTVHFEDLGDRTRIEWHMLHPTVEECDRVRGFVPTANEENLDKLESELNSKTLEP
ncbi:MAG: SRPBCC family protein [Flavobacteriales bacterium]